MDAELSGIWQTIRRKGGRSKKLIEEGDWEANYAYYALHKLHILPSILIEMDEQEKAFICAAIQIKIDKDKKEKKKVEAKAKKKK